MCRLASMPAEDPKLTVHTLRLLSLLLEHPDEPVYGLRLAKSIKVPTGTIYPLLARLQRAGWLEATWEELDETEEGRPRRRFYKLTGLGEIRARAVIEEHLASLAPTGSQGWRATPRGSLA
jgi:PadR family transcriptional regulator PadR